MEAENWFKTPNGESNTYILSKSNEWHKIELEYCHGKNRREGIERERERENYSRRAYVMRSVERKWELIREGECRAEEGCRERLSHQTNVLCGIQQVRCLDRRQVWWANSGRERKKHYTITITELFYIITMSYSVQWHIMSCISLNTLTYVLITVV